MGILVVEQMMQLPVTTIMLVSGVVLLASYLIATLLARLLNPKLPPVVQGLPLVGGIMQFLQVLIVNSNNNHGRPNAHTTLTRSLYRAQ